VRESEVDVILDASGFAYSDQWGINLSKKMAWESRQWKKQGKKIILLPQAFGPFENSAIKESMKEIIQNSDLVFARDNISFEHLSNLVGQSEHIKRSPDFTNLLDGIIPSYWEPKDKLFCIIPNYRMVDKTPDTVKENYLPLLEKCSSYLFDKGITPFVLIHESRQDHQLAFDLQRRLRHKITIIQEPNPLFVKGIIGSCFAVISSRFHGLINALSQGVPCLATGWSHKYLMLMEDYHCGDCVIEPQLPDEQIFSKIDSIINDKEHNVRIDQLNKVNPQLKDLTFRMWKDVEEIIGL